MALSCTAALVVPRALISSSSAGQSLRRSSCLVPVCQRNLGFCSSGTFGRRFSTSRMSDTAAEPGKPGVGTKVKALFGFGSATAVKENSIHEFTVKDIDGSNVDLSKYKGKVLLVVNVASQCGLTPQYKDLQELYGKYKDQGFEILAFPCNQFGGQEPGSCPVIKSFAQSKGATFQLFDKVDVNGANAAPVYKFLKSQKGELLGEDIKWNFAKFLVDKEGKVAKRYAPPTSPGSIEADIKALL